MARQTVPVISCKQWLPDWSSYEFPEDNARRKPPEELFVFSMSARQLRKLSGVYVRRRQGAEASGIQRLHEKDRSQKIADYVKFGYPFGDLPVKHKADVSNSSLKKPGWLPTAIVVNFLTVEDERRGRKVHPSDAITVETSNNIKQIVLPQGVSDPSWEPRELPPVEVIDGQHRLFAFAEDSNLPDDFELPVVAFAGLDIGWQAYLFWSINVSPKKINPSHAYDLFPLLRTQDWLEKVSPVHVYREARAQELTDLLYRHVSSPWKGRINMLGDRRTGMVSQAGWVQAIYNSFLNPGLSGRSRKGLFAAALSKTTAPLQWSRAQQAAFLIFIWIALKESIWLKKEGWAAEHREKQAAAGLDLGDKYDPAFAGQRTLLNQEQGVRGVCLLMNDVLYRKADVLGLDDWQVDDIDAGDTRDEDIDRCLTELDSQPFASEVKQAVEVLSWFDWRSSDAQELDDREKLGKSAYRGSGGYGLIRAELLRLLAQQDTCLGGAARELLDIEEERA